jgi:hypothetical protein
MARLTPNFDKFELAAFKSAGHNKFKVFLWALALLSGRYRQGRNQLELPDGSFCCVGVLCNINKADRTIGTTGLVKYRGIYSWIDPSEILGGKRPYEVEDYPDFSAKNDRDLVTFREIGLFLLRSLFPIRKEKDMRYEQH